MWLLKSAFSLGNGLSLVEAWLSTALDIEEVLSGTGGDRDQLHVMVADVKKSFDTVDSSVLVALCGGWDCLTGFVGRVFLFIVGFVSGSSSLLVWESLGVGYSPGLSSEYGFHCGPLCSLVSSS